MTALHVTDPTPTSRRARHPTEDRPAILDELHHALTVDGMSLVDITWEQHRLHEHRRVCSCQYTSAIASGFSNPSASFTFTVALATSRARSSSINPSTMTCAT